MANVDKLHFRYRKHRQRDFVDIIYQTIELNTILNDIVMTVDSDFFSVIKVRKTRILESSHLQTTLLSFKDRAVSCPEGRSMALFSWLRLLKCALSADYFKLRYHSRANVKSCSSFQTSPEKVLNTSLTQLSKSGLESKVFSLLPDVEGIIPSSG